jgi:hypothetical protein
MTWNTGRQAVLERLAWWVAMLSVVVFSVALFRYQEMLNSAGHRLSMAEEQVFRANLNVRLLGVTFPEGTLIDPHGNRQSVGTALADVRVVWIVSPTDCPSCAGEVQQVNRAILAEYPEAVVILSGLHPDDALATVNEWGIRTPFLIDEEEWARRELGLPFPSSFLMLNEWGTILHGEFHRASEDCRIDVVELARRLATRGDATSGSPLANLTQMEEDS